MRMNANEIPYEEATLFGQPVLFTDYRIDRTTVPPQLNLYELRHEDENSGRPCELAQGILVNFYGSILSLEPFDLSKTGYLSITAEDLVEPEVIADVTADTFVRAYAASIEGELL